LKKTKKWRERRLSHKCWKKELKRRKKRRKARRSNVRRHSRHEKLIKNIAKNNEHTLVAEECFSILNHTNKTVIFLNKIQTSLLKNVPVYIDISRVQDMTVDALLSLLALIHNMKYKKIPFKVQGNSPKNSSAQEIFSQSGFLNYVNAESDTISMTEDCLQIYDGRDADSAIAKKLCLFAMDKLEKDRTKLKDLYNIVMEIIINTKQHAYNDDSNLPKWYAYARYNSNGIDFSILDTGFGIPYTVRKNWLEKINELVAKLPLVKTSDSKLLKSVMDGEFRTKTEEKYRGKGIPMIARHNHENYIQNLSVISNRGFVRLGEKEADLKTPFRGTLYCWRVEK